MRQYAQYSTLGFQMLFLILIGYFAGSYLDKRFENTNALFTVIGASLAVVISLVWIILKLVKQK